MVSQTILQRVAAGDGSAVDECLAMYSGLVWSLARRYSPTPTDAEDAVQEVFIDLWKNASRYDSAVGSEATYVAMIARRRLIDRYRKHRRSPATSSMPADLVDAAEPQFETAEIQEEAARARQSMEQLRPEEKLVLDLSLHHGLSHREIAESTSLPLGTVKTHARRGLIRLRELLGGNSASDARESPS